jgi:DNA mismatch repair ATPase MutS
MSDETTEVHPLQLSPETLRDVESQQRVWAIQNAHDSLMETNRTCRVLNLLRMRVAEAQDWAHVRKDLDAVSTLRQVASMVRMANRRIQLVNRMSMFSATQEDDREFKALNAELERQKFDEGNFLKKAVDDGLMTAKEVENIMEGLDADGSPLGKKP